MARLNIILLGVAIICALSVVTAQHNARKRYIELQKEQKIGHDLDIEWGRLQLEQGTWATHARVEFKAVHQLMMQTPSHERIHIIVSPERKN